MRPNPIKKRTVLLIICAALLVAELIFLGVLHFGRPDEEVMAPTTVVPTTEPSTEAVTEEPTEEPTEAPTEEPTEEPTEVPTETGSTEAEDNSYLLTFVGDCTFGSTAANWNNGNHFVKTIGTNYDWPFDKVRHLFEADDFTMLNLEGPLTDSTSGAANKTFAFRGPTAYTQIMTGSSVEAVTLANNHSADYGKAGYASTKTALESAGIGYVEENKTALYTTESGLVIGLYADAFEFSASSIRTNVSNLKQQGADVIVCAFHWGTEGSYRPSSAMQSFAYAAIDAGADIIYGHHPHVLQKIEKYGDGIIFYSLGNFSFGGSSSPQDYDSAIVQQEIIRNEDGSLSLGELTIIPVSVSSSTKRNNFQPSILEEGSKAYERIMTKLDGTFKGPDLVVDYSKLEGNTGSETETEPPKADPPATEAPPTTGGTTGGDTSGGTTGGDTSGGTTGGDTSGGTTGGDTSGGTTGGDTSGGTTGGDSGTSTPAPAPDPAPAPAPDPAPAPAPDAGAGTGEG